MQDTIFALSSGAPPAGIAVIRISGPGAGAALEALVGDLPEQRLASLRTLRDRDGHALDEALVLWFPAPKTVTGENVAELHCHGGRAVVAAVMAELATLADLREAEAGEFTRRAFANGRIDLAEAEGLGDLLAAETEWQRRGAMSAAGGGLSRRIEEWRTQLLGLSAQVEAAIDFSDEDDVEVLPTDFVDELSTLRAEIDNVLSRPSADRLRDGVRVVFAGPPNAGKSSLFNALLDEGAAIVSPVAGTTRDVIERPVAIGGVPFVFIDTAGLRQEGAGDIEAIGIDRAQRELEKADIVLWLGPPADCPAGAIQIAPKADLDDAGNEGHAVSAVTGSGLDDLVRVLVDRAKDLLPPPDRIAFNRRQKGLATTCGEHLAGASRVSDTLVIAEELRLARVALDSMSGRNSTEDMLDALFGRFCIGK
ncbi:tRNA uridine-5-carboxymethylaminomethyl(34) synthesis GTPase MnmE [Qipengyuania sp. G39]|uniref:tRNA modification GTPase MnmE n=1 Tax=Qipengyuania profundimaris TaxID=3067652 RepID=A0ABT9HKS3_9SPHN|nr:tRNA uridine-5-carboxymethylaminomethyl(34) synthesis GTPase MnmE [Qipengyuania sp. G39]MDP4573757.1 tRNA uridine-5-carboxymethylaminomethyl(34) synthesis GTPase MnmE [Qipengyuania sp. G39]